MTINEVEKIEKFDTIKVEQVKKSGNCLRFFDKNLQKWDELKKKGGSRFARKILLVFLKKLSHFTKNFRNYFTDIILLKFQENPIENLISYWNYIK